MQKIPLLGISPDDAPFVGRVRQIAARPSGHQNLHAWPFVLFEQQRSSSPARSFRGRDQSGSASADDDDVEDGGAERMGTSFHAAQFAGRAGAILQPEGKHKKNRENRSHERQHPDDRLPRVVQDGTQQFVTRRPVHEAHGDNQRHQMPKLGIDNSGKQDHDGSPF